MSSWSFQGKWWRYPLEQVEIIVLHFQDLNFEWTNYVNNVTMCSGCVCAELTCDNTAMSLVLPVSSLTNIDLDELQLNSPACPVTYNDTHLTAHISLSGCGTKIVVRMCFPFSFLDFKYFNPFCSPNYFKSSKYSALYIGPHTGSLNKTMTIFSKC